MSEIKSNRKSFFKKIRGKDDDVKAEMSFLDHLEILRWHIVRAAIALLLAAIGIFIFIDVKPKVASSIVLFERMEEKELYFFSNLRV